MKRTSHEGIPLVIDIQELVPIREDEEKWEVSDLKIKKAKVNGSEFQTIVEKVPHTDLLEKWVVDSYMGRPTPQDVRFQRILSMKAMELYRFLCLL